MNCLLLRISQWVIKRAEPALTDPYPQFSPDSAIIQPNHWHCCFKEQTVCWLERTFRVSTEETVSKSIWSTDLLWHRFLLWKVWRIFAWNETKGDFVEFTFVFKFQMRDCRQPVTVKNRFRIIQPNPYIETEVSCNLCKVSRVSVNSFRHYFTTLTCLPHHNEYIHPEWTCPICRDQSYMCLLVWLMDF